MPNNPSIEFLKSDNDLDGLVKALRSPRSSTLRAEAAQALGEMGDVKAVESLVRSTLEDPDSAVQAASSAALTQLLGSNAELAIASYRSGPPDPDPWIKPMLAGDLLEGTWDTPNDGGQSAATGQEDAWGASSDEVLDGKTTWNQEDMDGLMALLRSNTPDELRLRAIQAMKSIPDARVVDALASVTLWGEGEAVRRSAKEALEDLVGDNLEEVLQGYQQAGYVEDDDEGSQYLYLENEAGTGEEEEEETLEEDEPEPEPAYPPNRGAKRDPPNRGAKRDRSSPSIAAIPNTPVIQEEKPVGQVVLLIFIIIVAAAAVAYYFLSR
jgi:hypothetical protein